VREALFNIWSQQIDGCRFLDLFAGSGAMGLEALSRGAARVAWVEKAAEAVAAIRRNLGDLGELAESAGRRQETRVLRLDLPAQASRIAEAGTSWDLVYADPPYAFVDYEELAASVAPHLAPDGVMAIEHSARRNFGDTVGDTDERFSSLHITDRRVWGDCAVTFLAAVRPHGGTP
jgi:16S rRNA (guanine(966)-N(2))-methyltransferase RsmD